MPEPLLYVVSGLAVGALVGTTGIGGGTLLTPILLSVFGEPPAIAVGTGLAVAAATRLAVAAPLHRSGHIDWQIARRLAIGGVPAALGLLAWLGWSARTPSELDRLIVHGIAIMLLASGAGLLLHGALNRLGLRVTGAALARAERAKPALTVAVGALTGIAVSLTSVGGGAFASASLALLYPLRLPGRRLVATGIAFALPLAVVAALGHAALGHVDGAALLLVLLGSVPGALLARRAAWRVPAAVLRPALAALVATCAARLLGA